MNNCGIQQNVFSLRDEVRRSSTTVPFYDRKQTVVCPKPRRIGIMSSIDDNPARSLSHEVELCESNLGSDLFDIILRKGGESSVEHDWHEERASSPVFFTGSPPSRVSNPLTQDSRFRDELLMAPPPPLPLPTTLPPSSPSSGRTGGCVRANLGNSPVVRIVGFDCFDRDSRGRIPALA